MSSDAIGEGGYKGERSEPGGAGCAQHADCCYTDAHSGKRIMGGARQGEKSKGTWVDVPSVRDSTMCAFKDSAIKQVTKAMSGPAETWVPPAGLYCENTKAHCGHNMWELKERAMGGSEASRKVRQGGSDMGASPSSERTKEPDRRTPEMCVFSEKAVKQVTRGLSGPVDTWYPPAGLYCENSSKGCKQNMWKFLPEEKRVLPDKDFNWGEEGAPRGVRGPGAARELGSPKERPWRGGRLPPEGMGPEGYVGSEWDA